VDGEADKMSHHEWRVCRRGRIKGYELGKYYSVEIEMLTVSEHPLTRMSGPNNRNEPANNNMGGASFSRSEEEGRKIG
jgi:hypothetical protein